jgi:hypothetical protein
VRIGTVEDQDRFRQEDLQAMSPDERIMTLIRLRNRQFGSRAKRIRDSGVFSSRQLAPDADDGTSLA